MTPQGRQALQRCLHSPRILVGGSILLVIIVASLGAPIFAPHDPQEQDLINTLLPPLWQAGGDPSYPLGTDGLGRCILSRVLYGGRVALYVASLSSMGAMLLGTFLALLAGYFRGPVDWLISRVVEIWMAFPPVILTLLLLLALGAGVNKVVLAIVLIDWTRFCRVIRSDVMVVARRDYVAAARLVGFSHVRTLLREVLPAVAPLVLTMLSLEAGIAVVVEAIMSFVGLSVEPDVPAWGVMLADARSTMNQAPFGVVVPVLAIFLTILSFNLLGDGLRRALDPRLVTNRGRA
ncbi:Peptide/nickel transport system permease protein [Hyphomicrobiales bacterium]|nr:Peptide/nickel transport system permease protein [Hyphomicrobiales bacterium]CAH1695776.1 Peptide/nickel transport system permease protein [Hyphomicrobiales bacterium]